MHGEEIRRIRKAYRLTLHQFGRAFGVTAQTVFYWEHGTHSPSGYDVIVLMKLKEMLRNSQDKKRTRRALIEAQKLPAAPSGTSGATLAAGLVGFGLGLLLAALFGGKD